MTTKPLTRADLQRQLNEMDLARLREVQEIFARPAIVKATADLRELLDELDTTALHRSASSDPNALIANALVPLDNIPIMAEQLAAALEARINPPAPPEPAAPLPPA